MTDLNVERLERLIVLLEADAAKPDGVKFDMKAWATPAGTSFRYAYRRDEKIPVDCGTKACAFGLAAISGEFAAEGLKYEIKFDTGMEMPGGMLVPIFNDKQDYNAAMDFFGLTQRQAFYLFDPMEYNGTVGAKAELEVVRRIKAMIKDPANFYTGDSTTNDDDDE